MAVTSLALPACNPGIVAVWNHVDFSFTPNGKIHSVFGPVDASNQNLVRVWYVKWDDTYPPTPGSVVEIESGNAQSPSICVTNDNTIDITYQYKYGANDWALKHVMSNDGGTTWEASYDVSREPYTDFGFRSHTFYDGRSSGIVAAHLMYGPFPHSYRGVIATGVKSSTQRSWTVNTDSTYFGLAESVIQRSTGDMLGNYGRFRIGTDGGIDYIDDRYTQTFIPVLGPCYIQELQERGSLPLILGTTNAGIDHIMTAGVCIMNSTATGYVVVSGTGKTFTFYNPSGFGSYAQACLKKRGDGSLWFMYPDSSAGNIALDVCRNWSSTDISSWS